MNETRHTPGPWETTGEDDGTYSVRALQGGEVVARAICHEANSRLIAASPDLLAACKALCNQEDWGEPDAPIDSPLGKGRAAISKAEGRG